MIPTPNRSDLVNRKGQISADTLRDVGEDVSALNKFRAQRGLNVSRNATGTDLTDARPDRILARLTGYDPDTESYSFVQVNVRRDSGSEVIEDWPHGVTDGGPAVPAYELTGLGGAVIGDVVEMWLAPSEDFWIFVSDGPLRKLQVQSVSDVYGHHSASLEDGSYVWAVGPNNEGLAVDVEYEARASGAFALPMGTSLMATGNARAGPNATIPLADTSGYLVGEEVEVSDANNSETATILAVNSGTIQVDELGHDYTTPTVTVTGVVASNDVVGNPNDPTNVQTIFIKNTTAINFTDNNIVQVSGPNATEYLPVTAFSANVWIKVQGMVNAYSRPTIRLIRQVFTVVADIVQVVNLFVFTGGTATNSPAAGSNVAVQISDTTGLYANDTITLTGITTTAITGATNANPIVITQAGHGLSTGATVTITGVLGNTAANGTWTITVLSSSTYSLDGSTGNGAYVSSSGQTVRTVTETATIQTVDSTTQVTVATLVHSYTLPLVLPTKWGDTGPWPCRVLDAYNNGFSYQDHQPTRNHLMYGLNLEKLGQRRYATKLQGHHPPSGSPMASNNPSAGAGSQINLSSTADLYIDDAVTVTDGVHTEQTVITSVKKDTWIKATLINGYTTPTVTPPTRQVYRAIPSGLQAENDVAPFGAGATAVTTVVSNGNVIVAETWTGLRFQDGATMIPAYLAGTIALDLLPCSQTQAGGLNPLIDQSLGFAKKQFPRIVFGGQDPVKHVGYAFDDMLTGLTSDGILTMHATTAVGSPTSPHDGLTILQLCCAASLITTGSTTHSASAPNTPQFFVQGAIAADSFWIWDGSHFTKLQDQINDQIAAAFASSGFTLDGGTW